jgi:hypothetical protein
MVQLHGAGGARSNLPFHFYKGLIKINTIFGGQLQQRNAPDEPFWLAVWLHENHTQIHTSVGN